MRNVLFILTFVIFLLGCSKEPSESDKIKDIFLSDSTPFFFDLYNIKSRDTLIAATIYSPTSYFIYRGMSMGYNYDLVNRLAEDMGVNLKIIVAGNTDSLFSLLLSGRCDIIAYSLSVTQSLSQKVAFTENHKTTRQVLVQRVERGKPLIRNTIDLIEKKIHLQTNSAYHSRMKHLSEEIGGEIIIVPVEGDITTEDLIRMVSEGKIDYTISEEHKALINQRYYQNLDVRTPVSFPQRIAWAVRHSSPELKEYVDNWVIEVKPKRWFSNLYSKYFRNQLEFRRRISSEYLCRPHDSDCKISRYDDLIKEFAETIDWDWRLLAALIYQESKFDKDAVSWAGAQGLMQIMPPLAKYFNAGDIFEPRENMRVGTGFLRDIIKYWHFIEDEDERLKFMLANYNAGIGHVLDARRLAVRFSKDPNKWTDNVEDMILLLSDEKYYNDPIVRYGYCRGLEPYLYVRKILEMYELYKESVN